MEENGQKSGDRFDLRLYLLPFCPALVVGQGTEVGGDILRILRIEFLRRERPPCRSAVQLKKHCRTSAKRNQVRLLLSLRAAKRRGNLLVEFVERNTVPGDCHVAALLAMTW